MKKLISTTLFTILFSVISFSQNITEFDNVTNLITEDFTNAETAFPIVTVDNYFIIDNGNYYFFIILFILIFFTHKENIKRLKNNTESRTKIY